MRSRTCLLNQVLLDQPCDAFERIKTRLVPEPDSIVGMSKIDIHEPQRIEIQIQYSYQLVFSSPLTASKHIEDQLDIGFDFFYSLSIMVAIR